MRCIHTDSVINFSQLRARKAGINNRYLFKSSCQNLQARIAILVIFEDPLRDLLQHVAVLCDITHVLSRLLYNFVFVTKVARSRNILPNTLEASIECAVIFIVDLISILPKAGEGPLHESQLTTMDALSVIRSV